jgi:hypothetical protein
MRPGPWEWVVQWIGAPVGWELEVSGRLDEFGGGIAWRMVIGWVSGHGRERRFRVVVGEEVVRANRRARVTVGWGGVVMTVWIQGI